MPSVVDLKSVQFLGTAVVGQNSAPLLITSRNSATPNTTVPVYGFAAVGPETDIDASVVPKGAGAFALHVADGAVAGGNKRGANAVDLQTSRTAATQVASGAQAFQAGQNNTASGAQSVALGVGNTSSGARTFAYGNANTVSATDAFAIGNTNTVSGVASGALGNFGTTNGIQGQLVLGHNSTVLGRFQTGFTGLYQTTTGATATRATADGTTTGTAANQLTLRNNSVFKVEGRVVAYDLTTLDAKEWNFSTLIKRGANAATTALVGTPSVTSAFADTNAAAWTIAVSADTATGSLALTVTGAGTNQIRWFAEVSSFETGV